MRSYINCGLVSTVALWAALAASEPLQAAQQTSTPPTADILYKLHAINLAEIDVGNLADTRAQSSAAKDFGKMLARDHATADEEVTTIAKAHAIDLAQRVEDAEVVTLQGNLTRMGTDLEKDPASQFDEDFARKMVQGHSDAITMVEGAMPLVKDSPDVQTLLNGILPTLRAHRAAAQALLDHGTAH